jgi:protein pelota
MRIVFKDLKKGIIKIIPVSQDDLWLLSQEISKGALVSGKTTRKIKISDTKVDKKTFYIELITEKAEYSNNLLRISGITRSEIDEIPKGSHHSLTIELHDELKIEQKWLKYQLDRLFESTKEKANILLVALDRQDVYFARIEQEGYKVLSSFEGEVEKKSPGVKAKGEFYKDITLKLKEYDERLKLDRIVIASPAFFKDDFMKQLNDDNLRKKITLATCSTVGDNSFDEILKRDEVKSALSEERARQEISIVDDLFEQIGKDGKFAYGYNDVNERTLSGAVLILLITTKIIETNRANETFDRLEKVMQLVEQNNGKIMIINSNNDAGKRLDGITGIGAILRYKDYNKK